MMGESDDEIFEDAVEAQTRLDPDIDLETALLESKMAVNLFLNNKFNEARDIFKPWVGKSMYHTVGNAVFNFLEAVLTFDQQCISDASDALKQSLSLCNQYKKKNSISESLGKMVRKMNYDQLSPEEIHAELCYAESLLLKSLLSFIEDETLMSFIKAGLKIRSCYNTYKGCSNILSSKQWENETLKIHFESGVHVGIGMFNLMISLLPARVIKLLEFIGFSGDKELGLKELLEGYKLHQGIRQVLCVMTLLSYNLFIVYVLSHCEGNLELCEEILKRQLSLYPEGAWFLYFKGRLELMKGDFSNAGRWYLRSWKSQDVWPQFHHMCFWELMWTHCMQLQWEEAADYTLHLLNQSKWSKTIYGYQRLSILLMFDDLSPEKEEEIKVLIMKVPSWKQRFAGKSIPLEKFCVRRCERYLAQGNYLALPSIELIYLWNYFKVLAKNTNSIHAVYELVLKELKKVNDLKVGTNEFINDNKALLILLKGACLNQMRSPLQAEECFKEVLRFEKKIKQDHFLIPFTLVELGLLYYKQGQDQKSIQLIEDAKKNYTGYSLESRLHFRIHNALLDININKKCN